MTDERVFNFTYSSIAVLPTPLKTMTAYKDLKLNSLSLYVTPKGVKTFFVRKRIKGRDERLVIGRFPETTVEIARKKAAVFCGIIADKKDPLEESRREKLNNKFFGEHCKEYLERYSKLHKKSWIYDEREINRFLKHWFSRRLSDIKKHHVEELHELIGRNHGQTQANTILRRLSSIFNKAIAWGWEGVNPVKGIRMFKEKSRDRFVMPNELPFVLRSIEKEENHNLRDYFKILLLTGVRKTNGMMMRWNEISFELKEWRIPETKNGDSLVLPLTEAAIELLKLKRLNAVSPWVFPQDNNPDKHIIDPIKAWKRILGRATLENWRSDPIAADFLANKAKSFKNYHGEFLKVKAIEKMAKEEGVFLPISFIDIRIHDIRRTFGSYQALTGASLPIIGRSLGHKSYRSTLIYARLNLDPIREAMEKASQKMFS